MDRMKNADLSETSGQLWLWKKIIIVLWLNRDYDWTIEVLWINRKKCLEKGWRVMKQIKKGHRKCLMINSGDLSEEEKNKKLEYARNRYHNMSEEDQQKLRKHKKSWIHSMSQEDLQHQLEQTLEQMKKTVERLKVRRGNPLQNKLFLGSNHSKKVFKK